MRLVVGVGVWGVLFCSIVFKCLCCLRAEVSTCRSITACTILVGLQDIFSMFAMSVILVSSAATAICTLFTAVISSTLGMCVKPFCMCCVWACTFFSYRAIAVLIFSSTFFSTISSLIPSLAYKLDSVRAFGLGACYWPFMRLSLLSSLVRNSTCVSAASRRAVSFSIAVGSGVVVAFLFYGCWFCIFIVSAMVFSWSYVFACLLSISA